MFNNSLLIFIMPTLRGHATFYKHIKVFINGKKDDNDIRHILILRAWDIHKGAIDDHFKLPGNTCEKKDVKGREELEKDFEPFEKFIKNAGVKYQILDLIEKVENKNNCIQEKNKILLKDKKYKNIFGFDLNRIYENIKDIIENNYNIKKNIFSATTGYGVYRVAILPYIKEKFEEEELKEINFEIIHLNQDGKFKIVDSTWNSKTEDINIFNREYTDRKVLEDYLFKINKENIIYKSEYNNLIRILQNRYKYSDDKKEAIKQYNKDTNSNITEEQLGLMKQEYKNTFKQEDCFDDLITKILEDSTLRAFFRGKPEETALHKYFKTFFGDCDLKFFIENRILVKDDVLRKKIKISKDEIEELRKNFEKNNYKLIIIKLFKENRLAKLQELNVSINELFTKNESNNTEILDNLEKLEKELEKELKEKKEKIKKLKKKHLIEIADEDYIFDKDLLFEELVAQIITREVEEVNKKRNKIYQYRRLEITKDKKKEIEVDLALFSTKIKFLNIEVKIGVPNKKKLRASIAYSRNIFDGDFILVLPLLKNELFILKKDIDKITNIDEIRINDKLKRSDPNLRNRIDAIVDMKGLRIYGLDEIKNVISRL